jgi:hypothetical protein
MFEASRDFHREEAVIGGTSLCGPGHEDVDLVSGSERLRCVRSDQGRDGHE